MVLPSARDHSALSQPLAELLLIGIVILLAALVLLLFSLPSFDFAQLSTPSILEIETIKHTNEQGGYNYDSRLILCHNGTISYPNHQLFALVYRNGVKIQARIATMNGYHFISTPHIGIQTMGGPGCSGTYWDPKEKIVIDFTDGTFHPGDLVRFEVFQKPEERLISSSSYIA